MASPGPGAAPPAARKRIRHRIPVRLRHHWKPAALLLAGTVVLVTFFGDARVSPWVTSASAVDGDEITENVSGAVDLYDETRSHSIQLSYEQTDFTKMMKEFKQDGTKDYIDADLTIDGVYLNDVGIRLKGNSTLSGLRGGGRGGPGGGGQWDRQKGQQGTGQQQGGTQGQQGGQPAGGQGGAAGQQGQQGQQGAPQGQGQPGQASESGQPSRQPGQAAGGQQQGGQSAGQQGGEQGGQDGQDGQQGAQGGGQQAGGAQGGGFGGMMNYDLSASKPEELPWLIKIDEFVEGRAYQGHREISLRPGADEQVPFNEALSLSLMDASDQTAEQFAFTALQVNDRPTVTRMYVENPSKDYADTRRADDGVMYKARASSSFDYQGDDPTDYEDSFKQLNKLGSQDLAPVMRLIKWANQASDEEFADELDQYVDVQSLARYVATQNLILNFDDMAGPGKNYVLWYDLSTKKFSVLGWDFNLTFSGSTDAGPDDETGMGGGMGGPPGAAGQQGQDGAAQGGQDGAPQGMPEGMPEGMPADGGDLPEGFPGGGQNGGPGGDEKAGGKGGGGRMGGHLLKERFLELDAFDAVYKSAYRDLYQTFYASGTASKKLTALAADAKRSGAGSAGVDKAVKTLRSTITARTEALAKNKEVTSG